MTLLLDVALRSSVVLAGGLLLSTCLSRCSAALRHRVLMATLLATTLIGPCSWMVPEWTITLSSRPFNPAVFQSQTATASPAALSSSTGTAIAREPDLEPAAISGATLILGLWGAVAVLLLAMLIAGVTRIRRLSTRAPRLDDMPWRHTLTTIAQRYGIARPIALVRTDSSDLLATWGTLHPEVLLPHHCGSWTLERIHVVLGHELAHIRRHDWLGQMCAEVVRAVLWFNPLVWVLCTRLRRESEQACDDEVLGLGVGAREYAGHLLEIARCSRGPQCSPVLPIARPSSLERRIAAMLNSQLDRRVPSTPALVTIGIVLLAVTLPVAALRARAPQSPLTGTIYDATGAVIPGVQVALVDATQKRWTATTNASGRFELGPVNPGKYVLEAALPGFRNLRQEFELRDTRDWDRSVTLQLAEVKESITIRGSRTSTVPAAPATGVQPMRVGGNIRAPRKTRDVRPVYPASMRAAGLTGVVPIEAVIGRDGSVTSIRVLTAQVHPDLAVAAVDAVRQWQFTPTLLNGVAVEVVMTVSVTFDLD